MTGTSDGDRASDAELLGSGRPTEGSEGLSGYIGWPPDAESGVETSGRVLAWSTAQVLRVKAEVAAEIEGMISGLGMPRTLERIIDAVTSGLPGRDPEGQLRRLLNAISALALHATHDLLSTRQVQRLTELAQALLQVQRISPERSRIAFLFGDLHLVLSQIHRREGRYWQALWEQQLGHFFSKRSPATRHGVQALATGLRALRLGQARIANEAFRVAEAHGLSGHQRELARLSSVMAWRLGGDLQRAAGLAKEALAQADLSAAAQLELAWEEICREAQRSGNLGTMMSAIGRGGGHRLATYVLEATLWSHAVPRTEWQDRPPSLRTIRRMMPQGLKRGTPLTRLYDCAETLATCADPELPLAVRLRRVGELVADAEGLFTIDKELLVNAAAARLLFRLNQPLLGALVLGRYEGLSRTLSDGVSRDALGIMSDLPTKPGIVETELAAPDASRSARLEPEAPGRAVDPRRLAFVLTSTATKGRMRRLRRAADEKRTVADGRFTEVAALLAQEVRLLRGPAAELCLVAFETAAGSAAADWTPRVSPKAGDRLADAEVSSAHWATAADGTRVVTRVLRAEAPAALRAELDSLGKVAQLCGAWLPQDHGATLVSEMAQIMLALTDLSGEAERLTRLRRLLDGSAGITVPAVVASESNATKLTLAVASGRSFAEVRTLGTQEERSRAGELLAMYVHCMLQEHGILPLTLHPGNFLFDGTRLCVIGCGPSGQEASGFLELWQGLVRAAYDDDTVVATACWSVLSGLADQEASNALLLAVQQSLLRPYLVDEPQQLTTALVTQTAVELARALSAGALSGLSVPLFHRIRIELGLQWLLAELGAECNWHRLALPHAGEAP